MGKPEMHIAIAVAPVVAISEEAEAARQLQICNACRYCESFCAVFPAMTRRLEFGNADVHYLANLCHNCGACLHACQYAPPHDFAVNVPRAMAQVRAVTYRRYAWPAVLARAYERNGVVIAATTAIALVLILALALGFSGSLWREPLAGNFYAVFPHELLAAVFGGVSLFVVLALGVGAVRFWRTTGERFVPGSTGAAALETTRDALALRYLGGGHGDGCNEADDRFTLWRRRMHHLTFWGFVLCFASTSVATLYHYVFGWHAPYALTSVPVLLGTAGGIGLLAGPAGLLWLNLRRHSLHGDPAQRPMDRGFIALLLATSATGLALLASRDTQAMPLLLVIHLGVVLAFFALLPYGKFVHAVYRVAALLKYALERRRPNLIALGKD
jgi:citrate/tricarballylate utilization protein